ncbi:MAG: 2-hydroxymuconate tautomerase family protein [Spirochaetales bacterium]|nr:2-hydroxymuconate tautomerase family protein [Spirochaetales bacterium]
MPYISIETFAGKTDEQKKNLIEEVTKAVTSSLGVPKDAVWIVIKDIPKASWGEAGRPCSEIYPDRGS